MADIELEVGLKGFKEAQSSVTGIENRLTKLVKKVESGAVSQENYTRALLETKRAYQELGMSSQKASGQVEKYVRDLKAEKAAQDAAKVAKQQAIVEQRRLREEQREATRVQREAEKAALATAQAHERTRLQYVQGAAATAQLKQAQGQLSAAYRAGVISIEEYRQALINLNTVNRGAQKGMNGFGMAAQQTGYQVGDFLVQIQGGTNPMVAFGQQATQLVGVLYLLPPATLAAKVGIAGLAIPMTALIAGLGIAIPLLTAIGAAFMRTRKEAEESAKGLKTYEEALDGIIQKTKDLRDERLSLTTNFDADILIASEKRVELTTKIVELEIEALNLSGKRRDMKLALAETLKGVLATETETLSALINSAESEAKRLDSTKKYAELLESTRRTMGQVKADSVTLSQEVANIADKLGLGYREALKLQEEMGKAEGYALGITNADMEAGIMAAAAQAAILAKNMGISLGLALKLVDLAGKSKAENLFDAKIRAGIIPPQAAGDFNLEGGSETPFELQSYINEVNARVAERAKVGRSGGSRGSSGGGSGAKQDTGISAFVQNLIGTQEGFEAQIQKAEAWKQDALAKMEEFNAAELEILGGHAEARVLIEENFQKRIADIESAQRNQRLSETASLFGELQRIAAVGGDKMAKTAAIFGAVQATVNSYIAATEALKTPGLSLAGRFAAYASVLATGLGAVASIKSAGSGSGAGGGASGTGAISTPTVAEQAGPQQVIIQGLKKGMRISPEELQEIFDQIYDENDKRGTIFQVQT